MYPTSKKQNIQSSCDTILHSVRSSNLNFSCQETPFSMYLTVRKSLSKFHFEKEPTDGQSQVTDRLIKLVNDENAALKSELDRMKTDLEYAKDTARKLAAKVEAANSEANRYSK